MIKTLTLAAALALSALACSQPLSPEACVAAIKAHPGWKDPSSLKIEAPKCAAIPAPAQIEVPGQGTTIFTCITRVNAKNSFGAYTGAELRMCYATKEKPNAFSVQ